MDKKVNYFKVIRVSLSNLEMKLNSLREEGYNIVQVMPTFNNDPTNLDKFDMMVAIVAILSPHNPEFLKLVESEMDNKPIKE